MKTYGDPPGTFRVKVVEEFVLSQDEANADILARFHERDEALDGVGANSAPGRRLLRNAGVP